MKATELLTQQHREVSRLFKAIEATEDKQEKKKLFVELAANLVAHDGIERALREVQRLPKAPRGVLAKARAVVDALEDVLNQRPVVATQR